MTSHSLLADLDDEQAELILLIGRPLALGEFADARGWPVWDFVDRTYRGRHPGESCVDVLASLPAIVMGGRTYGLWWRSDGPSGLGLQPDERVGLSIAGLHHLWPLLGDSTQGFNGAGVCLDIIRRAVDLEQELEQDADWTTVRKGQYDLRTQRFASRDGSPVELLGQTLRREFIPLASPTTNFNYVVEFGAGRLSPLRGVQTVEDYIAVAESLSQRLAPQRPAPSPIRLPAALDYLGLVLDGDHRWTAQTPTLRLTSLADAGALTQDPTTQGEFDRNVSVLWNILGRLRSPKAAEEAYRRRGWDAEASGSLNNMHIWLAEVLEVEAEASEPMATIRAVGRIRQGSQHGSSATQRKRDEALGRFGLSWPLSDWAEAWRRVADGCAASVYEIAQAVRRA